MHTNYNFNKLCKILILIAICITCYGLIFPVTSASFSPWYGSIAKNIALSNNWTDLILSNQDWLDKPHFPFWAAALSFKIFGINSFGYVFPGLLFHLIGALYTYKLANYLYKNESIALLSTLTYLTILHLLLSAIDVRAEAYLLGQIMPAVYYWLQYDEKFTLKSLILGALFTGLALMTKGIFVIITIVSGLFCLWVYQKRLINIIHPKWLFALLLSFVFALPEVWALYQQFDLHPEKVVFGHTHVSGVRWFFIDSQFGRFFGTGPIATTNPPPLHQLFFIHTFLWAFLPWTILFPVAIYYSTRYFKKDSLQNRNNTIVLLGYFFISFIMFSVTSFQVDHYTNIIFPFAAIMSAKIMLDFANTNHKIYPIQQGLGILMLGLLAILIGLLFNGLILAGFILIELIVIALLIKEWGQPPLIKAILIPFAAILMVFMFAMTVNGYLYHKYDTGFLASEITSQHPEIPVVDYITDSRALEFYAKNKYYKVNDLKDMPNLDEYYLVVPDKEIDKIKAYNLPKMTIVAQVQGNLPEKIIPHLGSSEKLKDNLDTFDIILVQNNQNAK